MEKQRFSPGTQVFILLILIITGLYLLGTLLFSALLPVVADVGSEFDPTTMMVDQPHLHFWLAFSAQIGLFFMGFMVFHRIVKEQVKANIKTQKFNWKFLLGAVVLIVLVWIPVTGAEWLNNWLVEQYPETGWLDAKIESEENYLRVFDSNNMINYPFALLTVGLMPAVIEELVFRGLLLKKLQDASEGRMHFAVIVSSLLFAAFHMQPWNILPMIILALALGYTYVYTKDIRYSMVMHFFNNGVQITLLYFWPEVLS